MLKCVLVSFQIHWKISIPYSEMIIDNSTSYKISKFYTALSCIYLPVLIILLFLTKAYLYAGRFYSFYPVFLLLVFLEFMKNIYMQIMCVKGYSYNPKQKFKRFSIILLMIKQTKLSDLVRCTIILVSCTFCMCVICIFYGAPFLDNHEETLMFSLLIVILTVFPMCLHSGANTVLPLIHGVIPDDIFNKILFRNIQLTLLGAWVGAFVIPLDWDRDWQVWPIPCSFGALCGHFVSNIISLIQVFTRFSYKSSSKNC